LSKNP